MYIPSGISNSSKSPYFFKKKKQHPRWTPGSTLQRHTSRCASARASLLAPPWTRSRSHFLCGLKFPNYQFLRDELLGFQGGYLFIYIYIIYIYIPGAQKRPLIFEGLTTPQNKAFSNQNKGHLGSRYTYISSFWVEVVQISFLIVNRVKL